MNSMRLLILLTFILYETKSAQSFKHLKFLKSLLASKLSAPEQSNFDEEIYTAHKCELNEGSCDDSAIYSANENPIFNNQETILSVNPEDYPVNIDVNSDISQEKEYEKDKNTEWLLSDNINVEPPSDSIPASVPDNKNHIDIIKEKILNKIKIIKSKLQLINRKLKPVLEIIPNESEEAYKENYSTTEYIGTSTTECSPNEHAIITASTPTYTEKPIITEDPEIRIIKHGYTERPTIITAKPITVEPNRVQVNVEDQGPIVSIIPIQNNAALPKNKIFVSPFALWVNDCPLPPNQQVHYQPNFQYAANPLFATKQWTLNNMPYNWPVYQNQQNFNVGARSSPINMKGSVQGINYGNLEHIHSNPISFSLPQTTRSTTIFESVVPNSDITYTSSSPVNPIDVPTNTQNSIPVNTYADTPLKSNYAPFKQPSYHDQKLNYEEVGQVVNNFKVDANQPIFPEQANQWINLEQVNPKPQQYTEDISSYGAIISGPDYNIPSKSVAPSSDLYFSSTAKPNVVYPTDTPNPIPANTYADKSQEFNNALYRHPTYQNQRLNYGAEQMIKNFRVDANQPIVPEQANQWIHFEQANPKLQQFPENITSYITKTSGSAIPNFSVVYSSSSSGQPIAVYPTDTQNTIPINTYHPRQTTMDYSFHNQPNLHYQNANIETVTPEINDFKVKYDQPVNAEQVNQQINNFQEANSKPQLLKAITSYVPETLREDALSGPEVHNLDVVSSIPNEQLGPVQYPITYDTMLSAEQPNEKKYLNTYPTSIIPMLNNDEQFGYQLRGDMLFKDNSDLKDEQEEIEYSLKDRRQAGPDNDKNTYAQRNNIKKTISVSQIRLDAPTIKQVKMQTLSAAKIEIPVTKASTPSNFDNVKSNSKQKS